MKEEIIFDTDIGADADDVAAISLLAHYMKEDVISCDLLTMATNREFASRTAAYTLSYFGIKDMNYAKLEKPLNCDKIDKYCAISKDFKFDNSKVMDATPALIKKLKDVKNKVTLICIGPLTNIANVINYKDENVNGEDLINKKVKAIYAMSCRFDNKTEWNIGQDIKASQIVFLKAKCNIYICPSEVGEIVLVGNEDKSHPYYEAMEFFYKHDEQEIHHNRQGWDPVTLYAFAENMKNLKLSSRGFIKIDDEGICHFKKSILGNARIIGFKDNNSPKIIKDEIDSYIKKNN